MGSRAQLGANVSIPPASPSLAGSMSAADFSKLAGLAVINSIGQGLTLVGGALASVMSAADKTKLDALAQHGEYASSAAASAMNASTDYLLANLALPGAGTYHIEAQVMFSPNAGAATVYGQIVFVSTNIAVAEHRITSAGMYTMHLSGSYVAAGAGNISLLCSCSLTGTMYTGQDALGRGPGITFKYKRVA